MYTMGAMKDGEMTPYVNITILLVKFSGEIGSEWTTGGTGQAEGRSAG
jgi:hypothetical protein